MRIYQTILRSISFGIFLAFLFICLRIAFILYIGVLNNAMGSADFSDIINAIINGAKYDNRNVAITGILFLLIGLLSAFFRGQKTILNFYAGFIFFICIFVGIGNMLFYMIYGDVYNSAILGLFYDDQKAIIETGLKGGHSVIAKIIICFVTTFLSLYIYNKFSHFIEWIFIKKLSLLPQHKIISSLVAFIIFALMMLVFFNARFGLKENVLDMHAELSQNAFLRKITAGGFRDLYVVYKNYKATSNYVFKEPPIEITKEFFNLPTDAKPPFDLYQLLEHKSTNMDSPPPPQIKHIFYIVSESLSDWYFDKEFDEIGITSGLKSLIDGKHGLKMQHFLENAPATAKSLNVQIAGLFIADMESAAQLVALPPFETAPAHILKKLGYETRFYYGGSYVWRQLDKITSAEGFDEMFANVDLLKYAKQKSGYPKSIENTWGVRDDVLFDFLLENTAQANSPTFNMIMTTSLHDPYDVDLKYYNVPVEKIDKFLQTHIPKNEIHEGIISLVTHAWWYDKQITHFIKEASKRFPNSLFVITADHYGRTYVRNKTTAKIDKTVPLILYSPVLTPKQLQSIGSQLDITPTIVELVAPKGFEYASFGKPLYANNPASKTHQDGYALGYGAVATSRFIYTPDRGIEYFDGAKSKPNDEQAAQNLYKKLQDANILSSWLIQKGNIVK